MAETNTTATIRDQATSVAWSGNGPRRRDTNVAHGRPSHRGETVGVTVLFGDAGAKPLLGATVLLSADIEVDKLNRTLVITLAVRLKSLQWRRSSQV